MSPTSHTTLVIFSKAFNISWQIKGSSCTFSCFKGFTFRYHSFRSNNEIEKLQANSITKHLNSQTALNIFASFSLPLQPSCLNKFSLQKWMWNVLFMKAFNSTLKSSTSWNDGTISKPNVHWNDGITLTSYGLKVSISGSFFCVINWTLNFFSCEKKVKLKLIIPLETWTEEKP